MNFGFSVRRTDQTENGAIYRDAPDIASNRIEPVLMLADNTGAHTRSGSPEDTDFCRRLKRIPAGLRRQGRLRLGIVVSQIMRDRLIGHGPPVNIEPGQQMRVVQQGLVDALVGD